MRKDNMESVEEVTNVIEQILLQ
jgi:hypothetical protein